MHLSLKSKVNVDAQDQKKRRPLHFVCWSGTASIDSQFSDEVTHSVQDRNVTFFAEVFMVMPLDLPKLGYDSYSLAESNRESIRLFFALPRSSTACISTSIFCKNRSLFHTGFHPSLCVFFEMMFSLDM